MKRGYFVVGDAAYPPETHLLIWHQKAPRHFEDWTRELGDPRVPLVPYGSKVRVHLPSGTTLLRELVDGYGATSQGPETLHFGLGELPPGVSELPVSITWTNGERQEIFLPIDQLSRVGK